jgi:hypothetical protein
MFSSGINFSRHLIGAGLLLCVFAQPSRAEFAQAAGAAAQAIAAVGQIGAAGIQAGADKYIAGLNANTSITLAGMNNQLQKDLMNSSVENSMFQTLSTLKIKAMDIAADLERTYLTTNYLRESSTLAYKDKSEQRQKEYALKNRQLDLEEKKGEAEIALKSAQLVADLATKGLVTGFKAVGQAALGVTRIFSGRHTNTMTASNNQTTSPKAFSLKPNASTLKGFSGSEAQQLSRSFNEVFGRNLASGSTRQDKKSDIQSFTMAAQPKSQAGTPHRATRDLASETPSQTHGGSRSFTTR